MPPKEEKRLSYKEFVEKAITTLRKDTYKGIHTVYSGFNEAFKGYYPGENPVDVTNKMAEAGEVVIRPVKGGVMLYMPEDAPDSGAANVLAKMGL